MQCSKCGSEALSNGLCTYHDYCEVMKDTAQPEVSRPKKIQFERPLISKICVNCGGKHYCKGLCKSCYERLRKHRKPRESSLVRALLSYEPNGKSTTCQECSLPVSCGGLCSAHYSKRHDDYYRIMAGIGYVFDGKVEGIPYLARNMRLIFEQGGKTYDEVRLEYNKEKSAKYYALKKTDFFYSLQKHNNIRVCGHRVLEPDPNCELCQAYVTKNEKAARAWTNYYRLKRDFDRQKLPAYCYKILAMKRDEIMEELGCTPS